MTPSSAWFSKAIMRLYDCSVEYPRMPALRTRTWSRGTKRPFDLGDERLDVGDLVSGRYRIADDQDVALARALI